MIPLVEIQKGIIKQDPFITEQDQEDVFGPYF